MIKRITIYIIGVVVLSIGIVFTTIANLGVAPINTIPLVLSNILNITLGNATTIIYIGFVLAQMIILKTINIKLLSQLPFSILFGYLVDFMFMVFSLNLDTDIKRWISLLFGIILIGLGAYLTVKMNVIMNPPDGTTYEITRKLNSEFGKVKIYFDLACLLISTSLSLIFLKEIIGINIGTVVCALLIGKCISIFASIFDKYLEEY